MHGLYRWRGLLARARACIDGSGCASVRPRGRIRVRGARRLLVRHDRGHCGQEAPGPERHVDEDRDEQRERVEAVEEAWRAGSVGCRACGQARRTLRRAQSAAEALRDLDRAVHRTDLRVILAHCARQRDRKRLTRMPMHETISAPASARQSAYHGLPASIVQLRGSCFLTR
jgi:hypothetical protein